MDGQASWKSLGQYNQFTGLNGNKSRNNKSYHLAARVLGAIQNKACQAKCIDLLDRRPFGKKRGVIG